MSQNSINWLKSLIFLFLNNFIVLINVHKYKLDSETTLYIKSNRLSLLLINPAVYKLTRANSE